MGVAERRAREKEELRGKILEAATELFISEGYESVSMRKIADRIEYSPATIYLHFKDKAELCQTIVGETFDKLKEALERIIAQPMTTEERLRRCLRTYIEFGLSHPQHYIFSLCLPEPIDEEGFTPERMEQAINRGLAAFDLLRQGLKGSMEAGIIRHQDIELAAQTTWAMLHGITSLLITCRTFPFVDRELLVDNMVEQAIRSLR